MRVYIGIDVGLKGGIAVLKNGAISYRAMPILNKFVDRVALAKILQQFKKEDAHILFEKLHGLPNQKLSVIWSLARQVGTVETVLAMLKLPYTEVTPQAWQKEMYVGVTAQFKKVKKGDAHKEVRDTKKMALMASQKLFPSESFLATARSSVPHDGIVDAVLLAEYGRRKNL